jgi:hypothetical protein
MMVMYYDRSLAKASPKTGHTWPLAIYLAGKIRKGCWRHRIVTGLRGACEPGDSCREGNALEGLETWPTLRRAVFGTHDYVGPYFQSDDHGCYHGDDSHGNAADMHCGHPHDGTFAPRVVALCLEAIKKADAVFAWVDEPDCYGTVAELGYAAALGKLIWVAGPKRYRDMWFVRELAERTSCSCGSADDALRAFLREYQGRLASAWS